MDIDTIRLLYRFYAWKEEKYGAFLNSIDDFEIPLLSMIDFIYGEEENETFVSQQISPRISRICIRQYRMPESSWRETILPYAGHDHRPH